MHGTGSEGEAAGSAVLCTMGTGESPKAGDEEEEEEEVALSIHRHGNFEDWEYKKGHYFGSHLGC